MPSSKIVIELLKNWKDFRAKHDVLISYKNEKIMKEQYKTQKYDKFSIGRSTTTKREF
jgi:hypothetical protein